MISDFTLVSHVIAWIPIIGRPLALAYMCIIDAFYAFEWVAPDPTECRDHELMTARHSRRKGGDWTARSTTCKNELRT